MTLSYHRSLKYFVLLNLISSLIESRDIIDTHRLKKLSERLINLPDGLSVHKDYLFITSRQDYIRQRHPQLMLTGDSLTSSDADDARQRSLCNITRAASLAHLGLLGKLKISSLRLEDDLSSVDHLTSLISKVTDSLIISNISGCDLVTIFDSVNCENFSFHLDFHIWSQHLGTRESEALVRAMETRVSALMLGGGKAAETTLDIEALTKDSGQGKCRYIQCWSPTWYREELRSWANQRNWILNRDDNVSFVICRQEINV